MSSSAYNSKRKILNDPIYGFITIPHEIIFDLVEHPYFQRLRRISQLGLTNLVYSGATHTRFQHALGAMHLMTKAIDVIRQKGHDITNDEAVGVTIAILLHDIGHGPYSHTLEHTIVQGVSHESIGLLIMDELNQEFNGQLTTAIQIFKNEYPKKFLYQLVSSQLDVDRLDYLRRDSFFTGVSEGVIGVDRIIKMMTVNNDNLVIEAKGIYSIEKFLIARRLMYWQVYLHKTVLSAESMLMAILNRARELALSGTEVQASKNLSLFLQNRFSKNDFLNTPSLLQAFTALDDFDVLSAIKEWQHHPDYVLANLCKRLVNRKLLKIKIQSKEFTQQEIDELITQTQEQNNISKEQAASFVYSDSIKNMAYSSSKSGISLVNKNGEIQDIASAADLLNITALSTPVTKFFCCYPQGFSI